MISSQSFRKDRNSQQTADTYRVGWAPTLCLPPLITGNVPPVRPDVILPKNTRPRCCCRCCYCGGGCAGGASGADAGGAGGAGGSDSAAAAAAFAVVVKMVKAEETE